MALGKRSCLVRRDPTHPSASHSFDESCHYQLGSTITPLVQCAAQEREQMLIESAGKTSLRRDLLIVARLARHSLSDTICGPFESLLRNMTKSS